MNLVDFIARELRDLPEAKLVEVARFVRELASKTADPLSEAIAEAERDREAGNDEAFTELTELREALADSRADNRDAFIAAEDV